MKKLLVGLFALVAAVYAGDPVPVAQNIPTWTYNVASNGVMTTTSLGTYKFEVPKKAVVVAQIKFHLISGSETQNVGMVFKESIDGVLFNETNTASIVIAANGVTGKTFTVPIVTNMSFRYLALSSVTNGSQTNLVIDSLKYTFLDP